MDGAKVRCRGVVVDIGEVWTSKRTWRWWRSPDVDQGGAASSADLGGSSKYSRGVLED